MSSHQGRRTAVQRVEDLRLEAEALEMKLAGLTYRGIADAQGCHPSTAHERVTRAMARLVPVESAEQMRTVETERLEAVGRRVLQAIAGTAQVDGDGNVLQVDVDGLSKAVTAYVRVVDRKAKLNGLDLPVKHTVTVTSELDAEIEGLMAALRGEQPEQAHTVSVDTARQDDQ